MARTFLERFSIKLLSSLTLRRKGDEQSRVLYQIGRQRQSKSRIRFRNAARLQLRTRLYTVFASNSSPSDGDSSEEKSGGTISSDDAQGPPFLTILAGFLVFSLLCWVFGSIIMWLFGLIVKVPLSK
ncbi:uncharacterized protein LOC112326267 isoform X1 [Populus trichocarpa]|uniref:uncharacterized protein LOC112326267 isoform X1 n=1 Tax=Populus trichocarpa TaxID=3694 RepID=UPI0022796FAF|nr:uncharacterized protein LOC112326267 isoform X1 [Populus trichocarpa]